MKDAIILFGSVLMVGLAVMVYALIMDWRARRYSEREQS
jgi:hypothetical protein